MRSALYVPGNRPSMLAGALAKGADAVIVDLEDAVPPAEKADARRTVAAWVREQPAGAPVIVRVNPGQDGLEDARAVVSPGLHGLCLAKASVPDVTAVAAVLDEAGSEAGLIPLLETPAAVLEARELALAPRVVRLQIGEADLAAELGVTPGEDERELLFVRSAVVLASAAAGIEPPTAAVSTDFRDLDRLRRSTEALRRLGFRGRACIHPAQVPVVNAVFTPTAEEVAAARDLIDRFESAGGGVCLDARGRMVDLAVVREARRVLGI
ncbi:HpcH/HpaI aldolase/citrate lyase family protein [Paractinoplanes atraurantiacus]|uniref:Citrate lyase subunit beta / citryl-CoA lyase n=1 Tax=Paractinoplanes atraurantiacus TaxID=1036182 RepID=A0A285K381_9ACTN|nr:CoA ester lyase [Actinoplanes atraurantiacus]SNY66733.1 citrate lyase subunit beta / citryl-CoA lyase [Actinoplanes atraurantiacus]